MNARDSSRWPSLEHEAARLRKLIEEMAWEGFSTARQEADLQIVLRRIAAGETKDPPF